MKVLKKFNLNAAKAMTVAQMKNVKAGYGWNRYGCTVVSCSPQSPGERTDYLHCSHFDIRSLCGSSYFYCHTVC